MNDAKWTSSSAAYIAPTSGDPWAREAAAAGSRGTQRLTEVATVPAPAEVAAALGIPQSSDVVLRRRVVLADEAPVELADSYYPAAIAAGTDLAEPKKIPGGAVTLLGNLGYLAADVDEEVSARQPSPAEQHALQLLDGEPVLVLTRRSATADGTPFEYSVMTMAARERRLRYQMKAA